MSMLTRQVLLPAAEYPLAARLAYNQHVFATHNGWKAASTDVNDVGLYLWKDKTCPTRT